MNGTCSTKDMRKSIMSSTEEENELQDLRRLNYFTHPHACAHYSPKLNAKHAINTRLGNNQRNPHKLMPESEKMSTARKEESMEKYKHSCFTKGG